MVAQAQHYVPQFYLRAFAKKRRRSYYLVCYDKPSRRQFVSNVINIAQQTRFYDIPDDPVYGSGAEDFLRKGEPGWAQAIHTILTSPSTVRRPSVKDPLSEFAASLMSRTPSLRTEIAHIGEAASKRLLQHGVSLPQVSPDDLKRHQASLLVKQTPVYASILREMAWVVVTNNTGAAFWTSDNPLVKYNPRVDELRGNLGLLSTGIQL